MSPQDEHETPSNAASMENAASSEALDVETPPQHDITGESEPAPALSAVLEAILLVVAYHYGVDVRGGFLGVDIFFVVSGYLITRMVSRELDAGSSVFGISSVFAPGRAAGREPARMAR